MDLVEFRDTTSVPLHLCPEMHAMTKMADLAIFCQFRQISSSIGINIPWVYIGDFGEFDKIGNFGDLLPVSSN